MTKTPLHISEEIISTPPAQNSNSSVYGIARISRHAHVGLMKAGHCGILSFAFNHSATPKDQIPTAKSEFCVQQMAS